MTKLKRFEGGELDPDSTCVAGIDPSLTGFAVCIMDEHTNYRIGVASPEEKGARRLSMLKDFMLDMLDIVPRMDTIAIEGLVTRSPSASVLGELTGVLKVGLFESHGKAPLMVPPASLKKFATGKGGGVSKSQIMLSVYKKWGADLPDDNAADSYVLARVARGVSGTQYEEEVLRKLDDPKFRQ